MIFYKKKRAENQGKKNYELKYDKDQESRQVGSWRLTTIN